MASLGYDSTTVSYVKHGTDNVIWTNSIQHPLYKTPIVYPKPRTGKEGTVLVMLLEQHAERRAKQERSTV